MVTCPWSPSRPTELSPCQTSAAQLSSAPRSLISTSSLLLLALPWRPPSDFAQTDIPAWPVCSRPEPLEVGDIWDHTGEREKLLAGSPELLWEMGLVRRSRQPRRAPSHPRQGEERRMAPGNRFLAKLMDLQTSETSAQNTEESGNAPLLSLPLLSPSLAPQAARPSETKPKGQDSLLFPLLPRPHHCCYHQLRHLGDKSVTTMPRKSPILFMRSCKKHRARKDGTRL